MAFTFGATNGSNETGSDANATVQLTGVAAGDLIILGVKHEGAATTITVTDGTTSLTGRTKVSHGNGDLHAQLFYLLSSVATGTVTYTVTFGAARTFKDLVVARFTPDGGATVTYDTEPTGGGTAGSAGAEGTVIASGAYTTAGTDEVAVGFVADYMGAAFTTFLVDGVAAGGSQTSGSGHFDTLWYRILTSTFAAGESKCTTGLVGGSGDWIVNAAAFKSVGGGGGAQPFTTQIGAQLIPRARTAGTLLSFVAGTALALSQAANPVPFAQAHWPTPTPPKPTPIERRTHTQARPQWYQDIKPFAQTSWPLPASGPTTLLVSIQTRPPANTGPVVAAPFGQSEWPLPREKARLATLGTWTQSRPQFYADLKPFTQSDWPLPAPARPLVGLTTIAQSAITTAQATPAATPLVGRTLLDLPPARLPAPGTLRFWSAAPLGTATLQLNAAPFSQTEWPVPLRRDQPIALRTHVAYLMGDETAPFVNILGPVPLPRREALVHRTFTQDRSLYLTAAGIAPFAQRDWPLPRAKGRVVTLGTWTQDLLEGTLGLAVPAPLVPVLWLLPAPRATGALSIRTWTQTLLQTTLAPAGWGLLLGQSRNRLVGEQR